MEIQSSSNRVSASQLTLAPTPHTYSIHCTRSCVCVVNFTNKSVKMSLEQLVAMASTQLLNESKGKGKPPKQPKLTSQEKFKKSEAKARIKYLTNQARNDTAIRSRFAAPKWPLKGAKHSPAFAAPPLATAVSIATTAPVTIIPPPISTTVAHSPVPNKRPREIAPSSTLVPSPSALSASSQKRPKQQQPQPPQPTALPLTNSSSLQRSTTAPPHLALSAPS